MERYGDVDHQMKKARVDGMRFQGDEIATNTIVKQIQVMRENAEVYKMTMGESKYNEQLVALINRMPGMTATGSAGPASATTNAENYDESSCIDEDSDDE